MDPLGSVYQTDVTGRSAVIKEVLAIERVVSSEFADQMMSYFAELLRQEVYTGTPEWTSKGKFIESFFDFVAEISTKHVTKSTSIIAPNVGDLQRTYYDAARVVAKVMRFSLIVRFMIHKYH